MHARTELAAPWQNSLQRSPTAFHNLCGRVFLQRASPLLACAVRDARPRMPRARAARGAGSWIPRIRAKLAPSVRWALSLSLCWRPVVGVRPQAGRRPGWALRARAARSPRVLGLSSGGAGRAGGGTDDAPPPSVSTGTCSQYQYHHPCAACTATFLTEKYTEMVEFCTSHKSFYRFENIRPESNTAIA